MEHTWAAIVIIVLIVVILGGLIVQEICIGKIQAKVEIAQIELEIARLKYGTNVVEQVKE
jgi:hypothetical protein